MAMGKRKRERQPLRDLLAVGLEDAPPDHSTISRTRRLIDLETHRASSPGCCSA
jgi:transposase